MLMNSTLLTFTANIARLKQYLEEEQKGHEKADGAEGKSIACQEGSPVHRHCRRTAGKLCKYNFSCSY